MNEETVKKILEIVENAFGEHISVDYSVMKEQTYLNGKEEFLDEVKTELEKLK